MRGNECCRYVGENTNKVQILYSHLHTLCMLCSHTLGTRHQTEKLIPSYSYVFLTDSTLRFFLARSQRIENEEEKNETEMQYVVRIYMSINMDAYYVCAVRYGIETLLWQTMREWRLIDRERSGRASAHEK